MSAPPSLSATASRKFAGHLHRLTPQQEATLGEFKKNLEMAGLYTPEVDGEKGKGASHDDATLLRFLRARRFDLRKAEKQLAETANWRKEHDVDNLYANFDVEEFESTRRYYPRWTGRRDKQGLPVYVYKLSSLSSHIQEEITSVPPKRRYERIVALYETCLRLVLPLCSHLPHTIAPTPISQTVTIIDLRNTTIRQMWALRNHLQEASVLANANYPETLSTLVVVGVPGWWGTVWAWVKLWFDEATRDKVQVLSKDLTPLTTLIDPQNFPKEYGGELEWTFEDEPNLDDDARRVLEKSVIDIESMKGEVTTNAMPRGPKVFVGGKVLSGRQYLESGLRLEAVVSHAGGNADKANIVDKGGPSDVNVDVKPVNLNGVPLVNGVA